MSRTRVLEMIDRPFLGGGQVTLLTLAGGLARERFEIFAASEPGGPLAEELGKLGVPHVPISLRKSSGLRAVAAIAAVLKENRIDVLHTHGGIAGLYGRWAATKAGTPAVVHTIHGIHYLHYRNPLARRAFIVLERRLSRITDAVIFVSEADLEQGRRLKLAPPEKTHLIRNGVDPAIPAVASDLGKKREELGALGKPLVVAVSRLHRQKGVAYLLKAVPFISRELPAAKVAIAGGGPLQEAMAAEIRRLGIGDAALLLGERADAREILAAADVFVLPSLWEGLPYVLVEAAALGMPIVATDIEGVREVIRSGATGILVPAKNPAALAAAVILLLGDRDLAHKLGENARREIPGRFSVGRMIAETGSLYEEVLRKKIPRPGDRPGPPVE
ncbi:MAG: glycosyltransferase family 4 protein [Candidatus Aminicenantales bacterium]